VRACVCVCVCTCVFARVCVCNLACIQGGLHPGPPVDTHGRCQLLAQGYVCFCLEARAQGD